MSWQEEIKEDITSVDELKKYVDMTPEEAEKMKDIVDRFPMKIPRYYLDLAEKNNPDDPIRKMCIPNVRDFDMKGSFDTSGESSNTKLPGLQHKYTQTAMIISTSQCAMYCRHCFRKRLVGADDQGESSSDVKAQAAYVKMHPEINNVLISGGDAFMNSNAVIREYLEAFTAIPSIQLIRFGTRTPVVFPMRINDDPELLNILEEYNRIKPIYIVTHFNHPRELTEEAEEALFNLRSRGLVIRNQTVLLKGINDDSLTLGNLLQELAGSGAIPYYVFQCRPAVGVKTQFQVPILKGVDIVEEARAMQNGQGKSFRYAMSHPTGKIAFVGKISDDEVVLKYHQAKDPAMVGKTFIKKFQPDQCWLEDDPLAEGRTEKEPAA